MAYAQTLIDDFNDNSLNLTKWDKLGTTAITESSARLNVPCVAAYPQIQSQALYNITNGILAAKLTRIGTPTASIETEFYMGVHDAANNYVQIIGLVGTSQLAFTVYGAVTTSSPVIVDTTIGLGSGWTNGMWFGIGNLGSDNIIHVYKSADGQTWTEVARATVGGTFTKTATGLYFMAGAYGSAVTTFVMGVDDASYWLNSGTTTTNKMKVRVGGAWVTATPKVRVGGVWVTAKPKARVSGAWVAPKQ